MGKSKVPKDTDVCSRRGGGDGEVNGMKKIRYKRQNNPGEENRTGCQQLTDGEKK